MCVRPTPCWSPARPACRGVGNDPARFNRSPNDTSAPRQGAALTRSSEAERTKDSWPSRFSCRAADGRLDAYDVRCDEAVPHYSRRVGNPLLLCATDESQVGLDSWGAPCNSSCGRGRRRAKAQGLGLMPCRAACPSRAFVMRVPVSRPRPSLTASRRRCAGRRARLGGPVRVRLVRMALFADQMPGLTLPRWGAGL